MTCPAEVGRRPAAADLMPRHLADDPTAYRAAERGDLPAEALSPIDRRLLVRQLVEAGWTDRQIAAHTRWTLYTTVRVRESIGLDPNQPVREA